MQTPTRLASTYALAELPWFALEAGRLVLADRSIGPVIDVHTHLALGYLGRPRVDLERETPDVELYLPLDGPLDLDVYVNRNFTPERVRRMKRDLTLDSVGSRGLRATHTAPNLLRLMRDTGVAASILLPIDYPVLSHNAEAYLAVAARHPELPSFGSVHPNARGVARRLDQQVRLGARGVKVHPAVQLMSPDSDASLRLYRLCAERRLPVLFHCGPVGIEPVLGRRLSRVWRYRRAVEENPGTTFVLGHSGALEMEEALALGRAHDNVYLEVSCQSLGNVRRILDEMPEDRLLFGSDFPFYHQAIPLAKVLLATEGRPRLREALLWRNAARLFGIDVGGARGAAGR